MLKKLLLTAAAVTLMSQPANAVTFNLLGDDVTVRKDLNGSGTTYNATVGTGVEFDCTGAVGSCSSIYGPLTIDLTSNQIILTAQLLSNQAYSEVTPVFPPTTFQGFIFGDLDYGVPIDFVNVSTFGNFSGTPDVTFTANSISLDLQNVGYTGLSGVIVTAGTNQQVVPVPAALPMMLSGVVALYGLSRRRSTRQS